MKKIFFLVFLLTTSLTFCQNIFQTNGNVGIGTTVPNAKLDVYSNTDLGIRYSGIRTHRPGEFGQFAFMDYNVNGDVSFFGSSYTGAIGQYGKISFRQYTQGNVYRDAMYIGNSGNVGIGTTSPSSKLDVYSDTDLGIRFNGIRTHRPGAFGQFAFMDYNVNGDVSFFGSSYTGSPGQYGKISFRQYSQGDVYRDAMYIDNLGNIGIGTTNPIAKLDVTGEGHFKVPDDQSGVGGLTIETNNGTNLKIGGNSGYSWIQSHNSKPLYINELGNNTILNLAGGNVGIGTTVPDAKLTINGNIHAKEVKIDLSIPAPDYVFASDYKLKSLQEVEEYINRNSHLPEIPSAKEIDKNGLMLAEMNMNLLKKVEELTLYIIEQNKRIEKLEMSSH